MALLWIVLSGVDLLEDLDIASYARVQSAKTATVPSPGQAIKIANDTFENATGTVVLQIGPISGPDAHGIAGQLHNQASRVPGSHLHLYTLHSAFLI